MKKETLAQQIWYAGLGALARAESDGAQWLETLMEEGRAYEISKKEELQSKLDDFGKPDAEQPVRHRFDNIEKSFEDKVTNSLSKLGILSKKDMKSLIDRVEELERKISDKS